MGRARSVGVGLVVSVMALGGCRVGDPAAPSSPATGSASAKPTVAPAAPTVALPPLMIGSTFQVDPSEPLPKGAVARCGTTRMRARDPRQVAVSNEGAVFTIDDFGGGSALRDLTRGQDVAQIRNDGGSAAIAPDASFAVDATGQRQHLKFYALPSGAVLGEMALPLPSAAVMEIDRVLFSTDSAAAATITTAGVTHVIDTASRTLMKTITLPAKTRLADVSRKGERVLLRHVERDDRFEGFMGSAYITSLGFSVIDVATERVLRKVVYPPAPRDRGAPSAKAELLHQYAQLRLSPDGTSVLRYEEGTLVAIDVATGRESTIYPPALPRVAPRIDAAHRYEMGRAADPFAVLDSDRVRLGDEIVDLRRGKVLTRLAPGFVAMSPNGQIEITRSGQLFAFADGSRGVRPGHLGPVTGVSFLSNGRLASTTARAAKIWKTEGCTVAEELAEITGAVATAAKKPATLLWGKSALFLDGARRVSDVPGAEDARLGAVSADASRVFFASGDPLSGSGVLRAVDPHADVLATRTIASPIRGLAASPDGQSLAFVEGFRDYDKPARVHLVSPANLQTSASVEIPRMAAGQLSFAGPGLLLHAPGIDGIFVHDVPSLAPLRKVGPGLCCSVLAGSPDGKRAAGSYKDRLYLWDLATRVELASLESPHREPILSMAFSPDGRVLATGSADSTVLLWDVEALAKPAAALELPAKATTAIGDPAAARAFFDSTSETYVVKAGGTLALSEPGAADAPRVPALGGVTRVAGTGRQFCALEAGKVRCWGSTVGGVLGVPEQKDAHGKLVSVWEPTTIAVTGAVDVKVVDGSACALTQAGDLICWGRLSDDGPIVPPTRIQREVASFAISPYDDLCWVAKDGTARCQRDERLEEVAVKDVAAIAPETGFTCVLQRSGEVQCYGENGFDQLGDDTGLDRAAPVVVRDLPPAKEIVTSRFTSCALTAGGKVYCWGGIGDPTWGRPVHLPALDGSTALRVLLGRTACGLRDGHADCLDFSPKN